MISFSSDATYGSITLILFGEHLDPEEINDALDIPATKSFKKGDYFSQGKNIRKYGMWSLELKGKSIYPSDDIKKFIGIIPDNLTPVFNIKGVTSGRLSLWIDDSGGRNTLEITIDQLDIDLINRLGVQFCMTIFREILED